MAPYYTDNAKERDLRKLHWWSLAGMWFCCGLQPFIPEMKYGWLVFATFSLCYIIRDTIKFWKWTKNKENELNEMIKQINKKIAEENEND